MKMGTLGLMVALLAACSSTPSPTTEVSQSTTAPASAAEQLASTTAAPVEAEKAVAKVASASGAILINSNSGFAENASVAENVRNECTAVGAVLTNAVVKYGAEQGISVSAAGDVSPQSPGQVIKVSILGMFSAGNAFVGHRKSATVKAELYQDGQLIDSKEFTRNSAGGFMGGFKGSCDVLEHTVNTLGNDVAKWLNKRAA